MIEKGNARDATAASIIHGAALVEQAAKPFDLKVL